MLNYHHIAPKEGQGHQREILKGHAQWTQDHDFLSVHCQPNDKMQRSPPRGSDSFLLALFFQGCNKTEFIMRVAGSMDFLGDIWADASLAFLVLMNMS